MFPRPKVLVFGLELHWLCAARLPQALQAAGFEVGIGSRLRAFSALTRFRDHHFPLPEKNSGTALFERLQAVVAKWPPDLILPQDDRAALFLASAATAARPRSTRLAEILERSLGNPAAIREAASKRLTLATAMRLGIRVPASQTISSRADLSGFIAEHGFPVVLKRSFDCGGNGVFVCRDAGTAEKTMARLRSEKSLHRRLGRLGKQLRGRQLSPRWLPQDSTVTASQFISGNGATALVAAGAGEVLGSLISVNEQTFPDDHGPASVVRFIEHDEMLQAATRLVKHWRLAGLIGFDFQLDASGRAWLLECNPRATPAAHLGQLAGEDLCQALHDWICAEPVKPEGLKNNFRVAYFPQEVWRDPQSAHLRSAFHDVPLEDPKLLAAIQQAKPPSRNLLHG